MNRRAREVLTSIAAAGIGGAIGSLVGRGRATHTRSRKRARPEAAPDAELDVMDTSPYDDVEIVIVEGEVLPDDDILEIAILEPVDPDEVAFDARDRGGEAGLSPEREEPPHADERIAGDDRGDGENWIEDMLEDSSTELPAERPLAIQADMDQKLTSLDDTRPRRR